MVAIDAGCSLEDGQQSELLIAAVFEPDADFHSVQGEGVADAAVALAALAFAAGG